MQRVAAQSLIGWSRSMPRSIGALDAPTLSWIMDRNVTSVSLIGGDDGTSSRARLALTGTGVPASVFVKMPARTAGTRFIGELGRLADTEVRFYQQIAPELTGVPQCHAAKFDPLTGSFLLVLEDLAIDPCEFPDTLHPLNRDQAALVVELLARLHARYWGRLDGAGGALDWVYTASGDHTSLLTGSLLNMSARRLADKTTIPIENGRFIIDNYRAVARLIDRAPHTVMHGDAHPGNVYFRKGRAGLLDWQAVRRGHPGRELAYALVTGMTAEERQSSQRELLDEYRRVLAAAGGPQLDREELWERFRQGALYAYVATLATAGMGGMQDAEIAMTGLARGVAALEDLQTVSALRRAL
jgi:Phosphotransferase enzyme family